MPSITDIYYDNNLENEEEERTIQLSVLPEVSEETIFNIIFSEDK